MLLSIEIFEQIQGILHLLGLFFILAPYYYIEEIYQKWFSGNRINKSVKQEIVLITGTGHGIGRSLAKKYAHEGATVVAWDINEELNNKTVNDLKKLGHKNIHGFTVDITNRELVMENAKKVQATIGDVTILINNAGIFLANNFLNYTEKEIRNTMNVNCLSHFWILQAFLPSMKKKNYGHIVAISSLAGIKAPRYFVPYVVSKYAVRGLMDALREDLRQNPMNNIQITTVYPCIVNSYYGTVVANPYPSLYPVLKTENVAEEIYKAQINSINDLFLPKITGKMVLYAVTLLPVKAINHLLDHITQTIVINSEVILHNK